MQYLGPQSRIVLELKMTFPLSIHNAMYRYTLTKYKHCKLAVICVYMPQNKTCFHHKSLLD